MKQLFQKFGPAIRLVAVLLAIAPLKTFAFPANSELVFVGSGHKNIYAFWLNLASGALNPIGEAAQVAAPSFLATSPDKKYLYAISEGANKEESLVSAFRIDTETGKLTTLNRQRTGGTGPCHVSMDRSGKDVLVANYNSGSVAVFPIMEQGALSPVSTFVQDRGSSINPQRQEGPHAHCIVTDPGNHFAFWCDLGLDKVMIFKFDPAKGSIVANNPAYASVKPGSGPRHIAFSPDSRHAYVINEMASTLTAFAYDSISGVLSNIEDYPLLPKDFKKESTAAEVAVHPSGKFVYASNRGDDSIAVFRSDPKTGRLRFIQRISTEGKTPRNFEIDPTGAFLLAANQDSGTIVEFVIDKKTGRLQPTGNKAIVDKPMCVKCLRLTGITP